MEITPAAWQQLRQLLTRSHRHLRLHLVPSGCQGYRFRLQLVGQPKPTDIPQSHNGLTLYVEHQSLPYLADVVLDYVEGSIQGGFIFHHPHACACSSSRASCLFHRHQHIRCLDQGVGLLS